MLVHLLLLALVYRGLRWASGGLSAALAAPGGTRLDDLVLAGMTLLAWAAFAWWCLVLTLACGSAAAGAVGRWSAAALHRVAPAAVRRGVVLAVGVGLATASGVSAGPAGAVVSVAADASGSVRVPGGWTPDRPAAAAPPAPPASDRGRATVVVRPGDTLWSIAAASLGSDPSAATTARAWPRWWAANRDRIGSHPDSLRPGQVLVAPRDLTRPGGTS